MNFVYKCKERIALYVCMAIIALLVFVPLYIHRYYYLGEDSIGYFGIAATMAGKDWSNVLSTIDTFSYGYSLLLIPAIALSKKIGSTLIFAAIINAGLMVLSFYCIYKCCQKIFNVKESLVLAFALALYSGSISASQYYGADLLVLTEFSFLIYVVLLYIEAPKIKYAVLLTTIGTFIYATHRIALIVMISFFVLNVVMLMGKKIDTKLFLEYLIFQIVLFLVAKYAYSINGQLFATVKSMDVNSTAQRTKWLLEEIVTKEFWLRTIKNIFRQLLYLSVSSLGLGLFAIIHFAITTVVNFKKNMFEHPFFYFKGFIICTYLLQILVVSVVLNPTSVSYLGMGRYSDYIVPFLIFLYVIDFVGKKDSNITKYSILCILLWLLINVIGAYCFWYDYNQFENRTVSGFSNFIGESWVMYYSFSWIKVILLIFSFSILIHRISSRQNKFIILTLTLIAYFTFCVIPPFEKEIYKGVEKYEAEYYKLGEILNDHKITTLYWPFGVQSTNFRHCQVYCSNVQMYYYLRDDVDYGSEVEEYFIHESDLTGSNKVIVTLKDTDIINNKNADVLGEFFDFYVVLLAK